MKYLVDRERPYDKYPDRVHAYSHEGSPSFPSGHTATAFALATLAQCKVSQMVCDSSVCPVGLFRGSFPYERGSALSVGCVGGAAIGAGCAVVNIYVNKWLNKWLFGE